MRKLAHSTTFLAAAATAVFLLAADASAQRLRAERIVSGLSAPTFITNAGDGSDRMFITEQNTGKIKILAGGVILPTPFLNVGTLASSGGERGLLGLAFHPNYASNGFFFINYTNNSGNTVVARYHVTGDPTTNNVADPASGDVIFTAAQPFSNHNGGWIDFGPDGFLYIGMGDGGSGGDPGNRAQNLNVILGKLLRIDVDGDDYPLDPDKDYAIPPTNPFAGGGGLPEIFDYGLRNPWRICFDRETGDMYFADVGQNQWEEINYRPAGMAAPVNWGWRLKEGTHCFNPGSNCDPGGITQDPVFEYGHTAGACSITGGYVYRGSDIPGLQGSYIYGDWCNGQIWSFRVDGGVPSQYTERTAELAPPAGQGAINMPSSFGEDEDGEIYIVDYSGGEIFQIMSDQMVLDVPQMTSGQPAVMTVTGATPLKKVFFVFSRGGTAITPVQQLRGTLFLDAPKLIGADTADGAGTASLVVGVPGNAAGVSVWIQAAERGNTSNVEAQTIL